MRTRRSARSKRTSIPVRELRNIGETTAGWLESIGIRTEDDLERVGVTEAYQRLKAAYPRRVSLNALWAMQGALLGIPWNLLPKDMKETLQRQIEESASR